MKKLRIEDLRGLKKNNTATSDTMIDDGELLDLDEIETNGAYVRSAPFNVLAFGDSLTEGFCAGGLEWHPYTTILSQLLEKSNPGSQVKQAGRSGESTAEMVLRLPRLLNEKHAMGEAFSHVVILGGTNDLGSRDGEAILLNLMKLHQMAMGHGAVSVAVTIPESGITDEQYVKKRDFINNGLRTLVKQHASVDEMLLVDLEAGIPYPRAEASKGQTPAMWDDVLHLSKAGYDRFAELVYENLRLY